MPWSHGKSKVGQEDRPDGPPATADADDGLTPSHRSHSSSSSTAVTPSPVAKLRVQVMGAQGLTGKDRNGLSDPFIVINLPGAPPPPSSTKNSKDSYRRTTPVQSKTLEPRWKESEGTFEWDITPHWYLPAKDEEALPAPDEGLLKTPVLHTDARLSEPAQLGTSEEAGDAAASRSGPALRPSPPQHRPSNVRKLSAATTKILGAPVRITTRGAVATSRAVRKRGPPRPMRLRRGTTNSKPPTGTVDLNALGRHPGNVGAVEFVVWDKDKWSGNDYMGECSVQIASWVPEGGSAGWEASQAMLVPLVSSRRNAVVSGEITIKIGLVTGSASEADEVYSTLLRASRSVGAAGIRSVPADQSVGTAGPSEAFVDDGLSSDSESENEAREEMLWDEDQSDTQSDDDDDDDEVTTEVEDVYESDTGTPGIPALSLPAEEEQQAQAQAELDSLGSKTRPRRRLLPRRLRRSPEVNSASASDVGEEGGLQAKQKRVRVRVRRRRVAQGSGDSIDGPPPPSSGSARKRRGTRRRKGDLAFKTELGMDIVGIVQMEVKGAEDLPRWRNSLGTSFDMDAFVILSFGQRIFRTRVARHSLNPTWDEKLLFHVRHHESNFVTKLAIYDWDKLSSNDFVGATELKISELMEAAPMPDAQTGLYDPSDDGMHEMKRFKLPLVRSERMEESKSLGRHVPVLNIEAKFTPYSALRQRFWRQLLMQYDTNDSGTLSSLELTSMLDSLGSTLTSKTIEGLFSQFGKHGDESEELTIDEAIIALEREIFKPWREKRYVDRGWDSTPAESGSQTPALADVQGEIFFNGAPMDYTGPNAPSEEESELAVKGVAAPAAVLDGVPAPVNETSMNALPANLQRDVSTLSLGTPGRNASTGSSSTDAAEKDSKEEQVERVIVLKSCPLCHMPRLSKKAEVDIVTHLAVCASQDWRRVDSMVVSNFVTASQAHRKWYTKVITKISQGQYQLGANSANIIVQDRKTGELLEEKMQVYVRLGIRLLYKGARSRMEGARIKRMLKNMSVKQGIKFDSPLSAREIPQFIAFHNLNLDEVRDPLDSFKTFNEFFYRKLKEGVRPIADPGDPTTLVSSADCRLMAFASINEATKVWIKGREFTVERLLGEQYKDSLENYRTGGSLVIFRLAPQDYHRFHCPADAVVQAITFIQGQYYTVNPMAVRSAIDVYGENVRAVVQFKSDVFGVFYCVCIGAMMVGSINLVVKVGDHVKRGEEFGYYAFGGSTNVCIFEQGRVELDEDLLSNSRKATETLVCVGMRIGKAVAR